METLRTKYRPEPHDSQHDRSLHSTDLNFVIVRGIVCRDRCLRGSSLREGPHPHFLFVAFQFVGSKNREWAGTMKLPTTQAPPTEPWYNSRAGKVWYQCRDQSGFATRVESILCVPPFSSGTGSPYFPIRQFPNISHPPNHHDSTRTSQSVWAFPGQLFFGTGTLGSTGVYIVSLPSQRFLSSFPSLPSPWTSQTPTLFLLPPFWIKSLEYVAFK